MLSDGLYQVTTRYLCAGFVVRGSVIVAAAPILWKRTSYYLTIAKRIGD